jgi:predicted metal-binding membrane protein
MFLVGVHYLAWMLILGIVMAVEKNVSWGRRLSTPLGVVLIAAGVAAGVVVGLAG